jgi:hypothetical protein
MGSGYDLIHGKGNTAQRLPDRFVQHCLKSENEKVGSATGFFL